MTSLLIWIDRTDGRYWGVAWIVAVICLAAAVGAAMREGCAERVKCLGRSRMAGWVCGAARAMGRPWCFLTLALLCLVAFRWPTILDNRPYSDPDEGQMIAGALTLRADPRFWLSVDGTTHGPIADLPLMAFGGNVDYTSARMVALACAWAEVASAYGILAIVLGVRWAALFVLPLLAVNAFTDCFAFVEYGTEQVPSALIALACLCLAAVMLRRGTGVTLRRGAGVKWGRGLVLLAGVALGSAPLAKFQAAPIAATVGIMGCWALARGRRWRELWALIAGAAAIPALTVAAVVAEGIGPDFWQSAIVGNLAYAGARWFTWAETPAQFMELCGWPEGYGAFSYFALGIAGLAAAAAGGAAARRFLKNRTNSEPEGVPPANSGGTESAAMGAATGAAWILAVASAYAVMAPGRMFMHYLQLFTFPAGLLAGLSAGAIVARAARDSSVPGNSSAAHEASVPREAKVYRDPNRNPWIALSVCGLCLAAALLPQVAWRAAHGPPARGRFADTLGRLQVSAAARAILRHARPGQPVAVWGWMPGLWVETGTVQACRDGNNSRQIEPSPFRDAYRSRYLADLERAAPAVFVDAVGGENFAYQNRAEQAHESFPALRAYVSGHYRLEADVEGTRIYVRTF